MSIFVAFENIFFQLGSTNIEIIKIWIIFFYLLWSEYLKRTFWNAFKTTHFRKRVKTSYFRKIWPFTETEYIFFQTQLGSAARQSCPCNKLQRRTSGVAESILVTVWHLKLVLNLDIQALAYVSHVPSPSLPGSMFPLCNGDGGGGGGNFNPVLSCSV